MNPEQVKDHRKKELEKALGRLDEYVVLCTRLKVFFPTYVMSFLTDKLVTEPTK
jgi:hypothetical protein